MHAKCIGLVALVVTAFIGPTIAGGPSSSAKSGHALYYAKGCYQCHGLAGQGSIYSGPALAGKNLTAQSIIDYTRKPRGVMPAFRPAVVSDDELRTIAAFIMTLPKGVPPSDIPQLARLAPKRTDAPNGGGQAVATPGANALYGNFCAACHGAAREGGIGPALKGIGSRKTQAELSTIIKYPPANMPKLWPEPLTDAQVEQIAALLAKE